MNTATYVINRTGPSKIPNKTPFELWHEKGANVSNLKVFGTECFVHIPVEKRKKFDKKAMKGFLVGYIENCKGYRVFVPELRDVVLSRDVSFKPERVTGVEAVLETCTEHPKHSDLPSKVDEISLESAIDDVETAERTEALQFSDENNQQKRQLRDRKIVKQTEFYGTPVTYLAETLPSSFNEAINSENKTLWRDAMQDEINSLYENETWKLVEKPDKQKVISSNWIYRIKLNPDGTKRYKARLVVKGCSQTEGIDYNETFSPVVRFDTVRTLLSVAARDGLLIRQFDIKTAFLYGALKENVFMKQPEGFNDGTSRVCKLQKSFYGLK